MLLATAEAFRTEEMELADTAETAGDGETVFVAAEAFGMGQQY